MQINITNPIVNLLLVNDFHTAKMIIQGGDQAYGEYGNAVCISYETPI